MATSFVTVGCKHPNGVILDLDVYDASAGPNVPVRVIKGKLPPVRLRGWAHAFGKIDPTEGQGGYAFTQVPADFWEAWLASHRDFAMIVDRTIIGPGTDLRSADRDTKAKAVDHSAVEKMFRPARPEDVKGVRKQDQAA